MPLNLILLQQPLPPDIPESIRSFLINLGIATVEALVTLFVIALVIVLILRWMNMWWFGVTAVVARLDRVVSRLDAIESAVRKDPK